jgi:hypothetical protein
MDTVRIYIVQHEEVENKQKVFQGRLNSKGERQSDLSAEAVKDVPFDVCYQNNLRRAVNG